MKMQENNWGIWRIDHPTYKYKQGVEQTPCGSNW
jgi:hypothetical protein